MQKDENFKLLKKKEIYEFLEGSGPALVTHNGVEYGLPYYTASELGDICVSFGVTYPLGGSRWSYVEALLDFAIRNDRCDEVLRYLFNEERFENLRDISDMKEVEAVYQQIVTEAINYINQSIRMSRHELIIADGHFFVVPTGTTPIIETPKFNAVSIPYVQGLRERSRDDLLAGNYDSVITKSRTMMEEILVKILEDNHTKDIARGDLIKQYNQVKSIYGMQQTKEYDARVNNLLNGLERIVQSIAEMRNANSDAHGVGSRRINIYECEARLIMNSAITFCEYIVSVHDRLSPPHP